MTATPTPSRIGIFGGTFNPPHIGHLLLAECVAEELRLEKIFFVPAAIPPHKTGAPAIAANAHRVAMLERAIKNNPLFALSNVEIDREGISYTADTVRELAAQHPHAEFFVMMGRDNLVEFHTWREPEVITSLAKLVVMRRAGIAADDVEQRWSDHIVNVHTPVIEISATEIRRRVREGKPIQYYVTEAVEEYIREQGLYKV